MAAQHLAGHILRVPKEYTQIYEFNAIVEGFEERLATLIEQDGYNRLLDVLEGDTRPDLMFFGLDDPPGFDTYFNVKKILYINVLDVIAGTPFQRQPKKSDEEEYGRWEERMEASAPVAMWIWTTAKTKPELHYTVDYHDWLNIQRAMEDNDRQFVGFTDEDGERVIIPLEHLVAVEVCDEVYCGQDVVERFAEKYSKKKQGEEPQEVPIA